MKKILLIIFILYNVLFASEPSEISNNGNVIIYMIYPLVSALLASIITLCFTWGKDSRNKNKAYRVLLRTILTEVELYLPKFDKLSEDLCDTIVAIKDNKDPKYPTFNLYPDFLGEMKIKLIDHQKNAEIIEKVSECHFELSHMQSRLILHKNDIKKVNEENKKQVLDNLSGFSALINKDIQVFKDLRTIIKDNI